MLILKLLQHHSIQELQSSQVVEGTDSHAGFLISLKPEQAHPGDGACNLLQEQKQDCPSTQPRRLGAANDSVHMCSGMGPSSSSCAKSKSVLSQALQMLAARPTRLNDGPVSRLGTTPCPEPHSWADWPPESKHQTWRRKKKQASTHKATEARIACVHPLLPGLSTACRHPSPRRTLWTEGGWELTKKILRLPQLARWTNVHLSRRPAASPASRCAQGILCMGTSLAYPWPRCSTPWKGRTLL